MSWILVLILIGVVIVCIIENLNSSEDEELREEFIKDYINSDCCIWVKIKSLPKSFKIGNVYFDKCFNMRNYETLLSYVIVDGKFYDNGSLSIDFECNRTSGIDKEYNFSCNTTNRDLIGYVLDNLDKVEEVKQ